MSKPIGNTEQLAEPVAVRYDFDGYGYLYMDEGSGSDWASRVKDCEFLYTHPMRELTDEEIIDLWRKFPNWGNEQHILMFAKKLLKKASEK
jgi:hypothetical protein